MLVINHCTDIYNLKSFVLNVHLVKILVNRQLELTTGSLNTSNFKNAPVSHSWFFLSLVVISALRTEKKEIRNLTTFVPIGRLMHKNKL
jgi:hypothetical protein